MKDCTQVSDLPCFCVEDRAMLKQILPLPDNASPVTYYQPCPRVLYTSLIRQLRGPDTSQHLDGAHFNLDMINEYHAFCDDYFEAEILPLIKDFTYDVSAWMDHLKDYKKQIEVMPFYYDYIKDGKKMDPKWYDNKHQDYTLFSKQEKQIVGEKYGKCRAISACPPLMKWVKGPIAVALEQIFHGKLNGFKISFQGKPSKTWEQMEDTLEHNYNINGFDSIIDIDGSAWDSTQAYHMKYISNKIYNWLVDNNKITHVDPEFFREFVTKRTRRLVCKTYLNGKTFIVASAMIDSTTFSGDPGTLLDNTLSNLTVNSWILDKFGLESTQYTMFCCGDDFSLLMSAHDNTTILHDFIDKHWRGLGLIPKYIIKGTYENITFCSTNVILYKEGNITKCKIVRKIDRLSPLSHFSSNALHYSNSRLKCYYDELAQGVDHWAASMPFYSDYATAYRHYRDMIPGPMTRDKAGKAKMKFSTQNSIVYDDSSTYHNMDAVRISTRSPPDDEVYRFLLDQYKLTRSDVQNMVDKLYVRSSYSELEPLVHPTAQFIPYQNL